MKAYRLSPVVRDVIHLLPLLAGAARSLRGGVGATSANGVEGTLLSNGSIQYSGASLGLPFDVFGNPGAPVYGPLKPPAATIDSYTPPAYASTSTSTSTNPQPVVIDYTPRPATGFNNAGITPEVQQIDQTPADVIGKDAGDTFTFTPDAAATAQDWLTRAGALAPWYVWAAAGGGALIVCGTLIYHDTRTTRGRNRK